MKYLNNSSDSIILAYYTTLCIITFALSLSFNYVEGDDASTVLYHLLGRNTDIQQPYAAYHSGIDYLLSLLPANEMLLRVFAISISFFSGFLWMYLLVLLVKMVSNTSTLENANIFFFAIPFIIPEFLFNTLLINPTNISFSLALSANIFYLKYLSRGKAHDLGFTILLFGLSIPFRWSMILYAPLFLGTQLLFNYKHNPSSFDNFSSVARLTLKTIFIVSLSICLGIVFVNISGYSFSDFIQVMIWGKNYNDSAERPLFSMFATATPFITPAFLFYILLGFFSIFYKTNFTTAIEKKIVASSILVAISPFILLSLFPSLKFLITLIPILIIISYYGFQFAYRNLYFRIFGIVIAIIPWLIGIKLDTSGTSYGPGFEISQSADKSFQLSHNPDSRIKIHRITPSMSGGFYMPTLEGPRPLWGYLSVLYGGEWKSALEKNYNDRNKIIERTVKTNFTGEIFQDRQTAFLQADLFRNGFSSNEKFSQHDGILKRTFHKEHRQITINIVPRDELENVFNFLLIQSRKNQKPVFFLSSYSNNILDIQRQNSSLDKPAVIESISPYCILINPQ